MDVTALKDLANQKYRFSLHDSMKSQKAKTTKAAWIDFIEIIKVKSLETFPYLQALRLFLLQCICMVASTLSILNVGMTGYTLFSYVFFKSGGYMAFEKHSHYWVWHVHRDGFC